MGPAEAIAAALQPSGRRCLIVGEVAQTHDGSLGLAHAFVDAIADAGADAVKFQTHIAAAESTRREPWRVPFSSQDASRYDYWKRMEFTAEQWAGLKRHADERRLVFLSSPFSMEAVELLLAIDIAAWKVASGEITNAGMLDALIASERPILLSTGMSPLPEIDAAVERIRAAGGTMVVLQCTSMYPCPPENVGLNLVPMFRERYRCPVGLSDHSGTIFPGLAGAVLGIQVLEVHVALTREMFGPDVPASITTTELRQLVDGVRFVERMTAAPVDKDELSGQLAPLRDLFMKSAVAREALTKGAVLRLDDVAFKKPGGGISTAAIGPLLGGRLTRDIARDEQLAVQDVEAL